MIEPVAAAEFGIANPLNRSAAADEGASRENVPPSSAERQILVTGLVQRNHRVPFRVRCMRGERLH